MNDHRLSKYKTNCEIISYIYIAISYHKYMYLFMIRLYICSICFMIYINSCLYNVEEFLLKIHLLKII